ncbi:YtnP family quorum-quenching lactonase [Salsuginibacillus kocurii]|uniref:YtnP family quorum-quenching lactonase n=1 Tax=Salsuginibacillus kocurii TaxID=427078 RepID=UPI00036338E9|nr:MBL fold metallo-hydrolase [Salsuginibacillus kocurii]
MEQLQFGNWTLTWLQGGVNHLDGGAMFGVVPKPLWSKIYPANDKNQIQLRTDPILVQTEDYNFLIEAGIGNGRLNEKQLRNYGVNEEAQIDESLDSLGLSRKDIDGVLMTHLHFDHATGLVEGMGDEAVPAFPKATIYTSDVEWEEMKNPNVRSKNTYWPQNWQSIEDQVIPFSNELELLPGLKMIHTGGHSAGHSIILMEQEGETLIHMADLMPTHAHENALWVMAYDDYPMDSIFAKQKWMAYGYERSAWFTFYHDYKYRALKMDSERTVIDALERTRS